jgi:hypothetical protein
VVLIGLSVYYYCRKVEKFSQPAVSENSVDALSATLNGIISGEIISQTPYIEKLDTILEHSKLKIYLSSFSEKTHYDNRVNIYEPNALKWNNFIKAGEEFTIITQNANSIPIRLKPDGMPLNNISLTGISSDALAIENRLPSFSATFFINLQKPDTGSFIIPPNGFELFQIYLESPNYVRLTLKDSAVVNNCKLLLEIGNGVVNTLDTGDILKSVLMSGETVAITITYGISSGNKVTPNMYIGKMTAAGYVGIGPGSAPVPPNTNAVEGMYTMQVYETSPLTLGNTPMTINKNRDPLKASLLAFMYHSNISITFENHKALTGYLTTQNTAMPVIADVLTSASTKLQEIKDYITANTSAQLGLQEQLDKCKATIAETPVAVKAFSHLIKMDGVSNVTTEDLRSCSILEIKNRLTNALAATNSAATTTATGGPRFQINMPQGSASNVTPVPPS